MELRIIIFNLLFYVWNIEATHMIKVKNTTNQTKTISVVTREQIVLDPGEEVEFDGDIELVEEWN